MPKQIPLTLTSRLDLKNPRVIIIMGSMALLGIIVVIVALASGIYSVVEPKNGALSGGAHKVDVPGASGGQAVQFASATTPRPTPTPTPAPTPQPKSSPSGQAMPVGDLPGWHQIFTDDFTKDAPTGSWGSECDANAIVYTGDGGGGWRSYPNCYKDTYQKRAYRAGEVLSVHDGVLDFYLHQVNGQPAGANPSPIISGNSQYQTYGKYSARFKVDPGLSEYYAAWLLWPEDESRWQCAESDFPEGGLDGEAGGFAHYGCGGSQDHIGGGGVRFDSGWHTYTQEWTPGSRKYLIDDKLVGESNNQVYDAPQRWQLQTETNGDGNHAGHLLVDWVVVYSKQ